MKTPLLFTIFRRRETALRVLQAIRCAAPERLFLAADGPRDRQPEERELCEKLRAEILSKIDWKCQVTTLFRDRNLGCGKAMSGAVDWFFKQVEEGIILEDDCLPSPDFFRFCEAALEHYRENGQVMCINGSQSVAGLDYRPYCAGFSRYAQIWGWASWRRAWEKYEYCCRDVSLEDLRRTLQNRSQAVRWREILRSVDDGKAGFDTWDFQWSAALLRCGGAALTPECNLITNIGSADTTHDMPDLDKTQLAADRELPEILKFPEQVHFDDRRDGKIFRHFYRKPPLWNRIGGKLLRLTGLR